MKLKSKILAVVLLSAMLFGTLLSFSNKKFNEELSANAKKETYVNTKATSDNEKKAKYVFLFIGDGMAGVQVNSAQVFKGNNTYGEVELEKLNFTKFPATGIQTTQDSTSFCPDSASTATSISSGVKTHSGVIGLTVDKKVKTESIAEKAKKAGMKVGIISSVTLNHATPAAFYANVESRGEFYEIGKQMADSGFDYFAGGTLGKRKDKKDDKKDLYDIMKEKGYKITENRKDFENIKKGDKVYAVAERLQDSGSMPYSIDQKKEDISLKDFVKKGIEVLDNDKGFFMMCESGKIDWACHANDAATAINEVLGLQDAVDAAIEFYNKHPEETLIIVTGDHETGGLTIGAAATGYDTAFDMISKQKMSYVDFDSEFKKIKEKNPKLSFDEFFPTIEKQFGLKLKGEKDDAFVLNDYEKNLLKKAFEKSMGTQKLNPKEYEDYLLYGGYEPISVTLTHILNNKAGIGWTSYSHTGVPVTVYAQGTRSSLFNGYYDNTDIFKKMKEAMELK